jgi:hypothetical protein
MLVRIAESLYSGGSMRVLEIGVCVCEVRIGLELDE